MPFDGRQPCLEIQIIDKALEVLGPNGEHWIQGEVNDSHGNRCIVGAVRTARRKLRLKGDRTITLILTALCASRSNIYSPLEFIENFNDQPGRKFDEIAGLLVHARNLAANRC
jgi:hypothetical protein